MTTAVTHGSWHERNFCPRFKHSPFFDTFRFSRYVPVFTTYLSPGEFISLYEEERYFLVFLVIIPKLSLQMSSFITTYLIKFHAERTWLTDTWTESIIHFAYFNQYLRYMFKSRAKLWILIYRWTLYPNFIFQIHFVFGFFNKRQLIWPKSYRHFFMIIPIFNVKFCISLVYFRWAPYSCGRSHKWADVLLRPVG